MPLFTFYCMGCDKTFQKILKNKDQEVICGCGDHLKAQMPQGISSTTMVVKDPHRGVQQPKDLQAQLKKRMRTHHDKYEIEEKIDQHGMDDAIRNGWTKKRKL